MMKIAKSGRILSLLALLLVAAMLLTMVGCSGNEPETPDEPGNVATQPTDQVETDPTESVGGEDAPTDPSGEDTTETSGEDTTETSGDTTDSGSTESTTQGTDQPGVTEKPTTEGKDPVVSKPTTGKVNKPTTGKVDKTTKKPTTTKSGPRTTKTATTTKKTTTTSKTLPPDNENVLKQVPAELKGTKIKMLLWWNVGKDDKVQADTFKKETGIEVGYETAALERYQTTLAGMVMANNSPSLSAMINSWYPQPITRGLMQPLDKIPNWNFKDEDVYSLSMMDQFGYKGRNYGVALKGSNVPTFELMFFNKELLQQYGVKEDPYQLWKKGEWNWDTCLQIAQKCTDEKKGIKGMTLNSQFYWMLSAGQDFVVSDPKEGLKNNLSNPKLLEAWNWNWDLIYSYKVSDPTHGDPNYRFYQGKTAMFAVGSYLMQAQTEAAGYIPQNMKYDWGVAPFPSPKGKHIVAVEGTTWGFPVKVTGKKLQAAAWYLRYWLDDYTYGDPNFYSKSECWEVMEWVWDQPMQSYNSVGVLTYGGEYNDYSIQLSLVDDADTKAKLASNLASWSNVLDSNIKKIVSELE